MPSASAPSRQKSTSEPAYCGAKTRRGTSCRRTAGAGTDHPGFGHCRNHGGCSPTGTIFAARLQAAALALEYQVEPHEALLRAVGQAAAWELTCRAKVAELEDDELAVKHTRYREWAGNGENGTGGGAETIEESHSTLNVWAKAHVQSIRDLASVAKTAIDAGVEERRVRVAEALGGQLADVLGAIFAELQLTPEQRRAAKPVVRRHLELLEGTG